MRYRFWILAVVLLAATVRVPLGAGQTRPAPAAQQLPPLSYVCTMPGDEAVVEDKPGFCPNPKCGMKLVPVRLDSKWWCPSHQTNVVRDGPGKCPLDQKDLVQVTVSEFWTCSDKPTDRLLEPGNCANGQARKIGYELRAHGDHNPRHGGQFFMAEDLWHHVEGALPAQTLFTLHFYDNFTKPIPPKDFTARVVRETNGNAETVALTPSPDGTILQARLTPSPMPVKVKAWVRFSKDTREQPFDFVFDKLSVEPAAVPAATTTSRTPAPTGTVTSRAPAPPVPARTPSPSTAAAVQPPPAPPPAAAPEPEPQSPDPAASTTMLDGTSGIPPALLEAWDETKLPSAIPDLLAELTSRAAEVESLVKEGNLSQVWLPATSTKTVALVLDARSSALPERQRMLVTSSVMRIVTAAWELDAYGDLGNREKIVGAYQRMASAVTDLKAAYANSR